jgi:hypothetical protein
VASKGDALTPTERSALFQEETFLNREGVNLIRWAREASGAARVNVS